MSQCALMYLVVHLNLTTQIVNHVVQFVQKVYHTSAQVSVGAFISMQMSVVCVYEYVVVDDI